MQKPNLLLFQFGDVICSSIDDLLHSFTLIGKKYFM